MRGKRRRWSKEYQQYLGQRSFWSRQKKAKRQTIQEEVRHQQATSHDDLVPSHVLHNTRRLIGPTVDTARDGLTKEEADQIDLSLFKDEMRWRPYLAEMDDGTKELRYRLRPKHWGQRSGGKWFPESSEANYVPPDYIPPSKYLTIVECDMQRTHKFLLPAWGEKPSASVGENNEDNHHAQEPESVHLGVANPVPDAIVNNGDNNAMAEVHVMAKKIVVCSILDNDK